MDLSIVIVSWNVKDLLKRNLEAIFTSTQNISFEVFVIDNNSRDDTVEMIKKNFPKVKVMANTENLGFSKANNQGIKLSSGRHILLLNPDMRVKEGTLEKMVSWMDKNSDAAVAGCRLVDENGKNISHIRRFPSFFDQLMIILKIPHLFPFVLNRYLYKNFDYDKEAKVDLIRGSFFYNQTRNHRTNWTA